MPQTVSQTEKTKKLFCPRLRLAAALAPDHGRHGHVLKCRELRKELVELKHKTYVGIPERRQFPVFQPRNICAVVAYTSRIGRIERTGYLQKRGLPRSARPDDGENLAIGYFHVNPT